MQRLDIGARASRLAAPIGVDRLVQPRHDLAAAERLFDEVERAVLDGAHRHGDIPLAGDHEDRCWIILAVQFLEDIEAGLAGDMHVKQDA